MSLGIGLRKGPRRVRDPCSKTTKQVVGEMEWRIKEMTLQFRPGTRLPFHKSECYMNISITRKRRLLGPSTNPFSDFSCESSFELSPL